MSKFFVPYSGKHRSGLCCTGSKLDNEYCEVINRDGEIVVAKTGLVNNWAKTQESRESDIYELIEQSGVDPLVLHNQQVDIEGMVDDFTAFPRTLAEAHEVMMKGERAFYELPLDVRNEFGGSSRRMMRSIEEGTFAERVQKYIPKKVENVSEVKDGQSEK